MATILTAAFIVFLVLWCVLLWVALNSRDPGRVPHQGFGCLCVCHVGPVRGRSRECAHCLPIEKYPGRA